MEVAILNGFGIKHLRILNPFGNLKGQFHEIFWYTFLFINQLHFGPWLSSVKLFPYVSTFAVVLTL